jgi:hypothetical protein
LEGGGGTQKEEHDAGKIKFLFRIILTFIVGKWMRMVFEQRRKNYIAASETKKF